VNSTLACALVTSKLREQTGARLAHVEAGLRSGDWSMPEEVNRVLTDRLADLLLTPSPDAEPNLLAEGIEADRIALVGNVMIDTLLGLLPAARALGMPARMGQLPGGYALATLHRPSNVDDPGVLRTALTALGEVDLPVVFPVHPRTRRNAERFGLEHLLEPLHTIEPVGYLEMAGLLDGCAVVLTDSGGLQEETTALGVPCVTLREHTERPVTVSEGTNRMVEWPLTISGVRTEYEASLARGRVGVGECCPAGWDGRASERVVAQLEARSDIALLSGRCVDRGGVLAAGRAVA
jgi:UDP-N-acetylglucosamine 2-epimerase (non-hydrolysing)